MNNYCVYKHTTPSGKVYIGITSQNINKRWKNGLGYEGCTAFYRAIQKYGWENITHEIVTAGLSKIEACEIEQRLIEEYKSHDPKYGYNLTHGGEHYEPNEEWRRKLSESNKRYYREHPEARERISKGQMGREITDLQREKISNSLKQYYIDHPEEREKRGRSFRGKKRGDEFSKKVGERKSKPIRCVETNKEYRSIKEAAEDIGANRSGITNILTGRRKTCRGLTFVYL